MAPRPAAPTPASGAAEQAPVISTLKPVASQQAAQATEASRQLTTSNLLAHTRAKPPDTLSRVYTFLRSLPPSQQPHASSASLPAVKDGDKAAPSPSPFVPPPIEPLEPPEPRQDKASARETALVLHAPGSADKEAARPGSTERLPSGKGNAAADNAPAPASRRSIVGSMRPRNSASNTNAASAVASQQQKAVTPPPPPPAAVARTSKGPMLSPLLISRAQRARESTANEINDRLNDNAVAGSEPEEGVSPAAQDDEVDEEELEHLERLAARRERRRAKAAITKYPQQTAEASRKARNGKAEALKESRSPAGKTKRRARSDSDAHAAMASDGCSSEGAPRREKRHEPASTSKKRRKTADDASAGDLEAFKRPSNITAKGRLTIKPKTPLKLGLFARGAASGRIYERGRPLPDLVFNELDFLAKPRWLPRAADDRDAVESEPPAERRPRSPSLKRRHRSDEAPPASRKQKQRLTSSRRQPPPPSSAAAPPLKRSRHSSPYKEHSSRREEESEDGDEHSAYSLQQRKNAGRAFQREPTISEAPTGSANSSERQQRLAAGPSPLAAAQPPTSEADSFSVAMPRSVVLDTTALMAQALPSVAEVLSHVSPSVYAPSVPSVVDELSTPRLPSTERAADDAASFDYDAFLDDILDDNLSLLCESHDGGALVDQQPAQAPLAGEAQLALQHDGGGTDDEDLGSDEVWPQILYPPLVATSVQALASDDDDDFRTAMRQHWYRARP